MDGWTTLPQSLQQWIKLVCCCILWSCCCCIVIVAPHHPHPPFTGARSRLEHGSRACMQRKAQATWRTQSHRPYSRESIISPAPSLFASFPAALMGLFALRSSIPHYLDERNEQILPAFSFLRHTQAALKALSRMCCLLFCYISIRSF